jgi:serine/threonine protein kinase
MAHPWDSNWIIGARLGDGAQGLTYEVTSKGVANVVAALKRLRNNQSEQARARMHREVANLQSLSSAGGAVPRVLDHNTDRFQDKAVELYLVMDLIEGPTLKAYVEKHGRLNVDLAIECVLAMCETFRIAHTFPIVHRDLKPDNVVLNGGHVGAPIVVDYGLSFNASDEDVTLTGEMLQNRFLSLPETTTPGGNLRDPRSDLTALCGILYYCLTSHVPGQLQDSNGTLPHLRPGFSVRELQNDNRVPFLLELFSRGFSPNISNRYQRIEDLTDRLVAIRSSDTPVRELDPIKLAAVYAERLRLHHRPTQIAEFRGVAQRFLNAIRDDFQSYNGKLKGFHVQADGDPPFQLQETSPLAAGIDLVAVSQFSLRLQAANHNTVRRRKFAIGSVGERCILFAGDTHKLAHQVALNDYAWHEVVSYEGDPASVFTLVFDSNKDWVRVQLKSLMDEVLPNQS